VIAAAASVLAAPLAASAQQPPDTQGLIQEREASREQLRQQDEERARRALIEREQNERAARQRLESGRIERMQAPTLMQGAPPNLSGGATLPGYTDRAGEMSRDDAARRDRLNYDSAVRAREEVERPGSTIGRPEPWKPTGAR
jgi:hypothetical protein